MTLSPLLRNILLGISLCQLSTAYAHGPTPRKTDESVSIAAPAATVWKKLSTDCSIASWHPQVKGCEIINDKQQKISLSNGTFLLMETDQIDQENTTIFYRLSGEIDIAALAVSSLNGKLRVSSEADGSKVNWSARYYRAFTGNEPPEGQDDEAAQAAVDAFVKAGLSSLQKSTF